MHVAAVQQPWLCWFENVANIVSMQGKKVWGAVRGMAKAAGFEIRAEVV